MIGFKVTGKLAGEWQYFANNTNVILIIQLQALTFEQLIKNIYCTNLLYSLY
jgi:hypothetical protein